MKTERMFGKNGKADGISKRKRLFEIGPLFAIFKETRSHYGGPVAKRT